MLVDIYKAEIAYPSTLIEARFLETLKIGPFHQTITGQVLERP